MSLKPPHDPGDYLPLLAIAAALAGWLATSLWAGRIGLPGVGWARRAERPLTFWTSAAGLLVLALACVAYFLSQQPRI